jgi:peptidoglycan/xylan/chitin deacetylase (PgdA/CDA1 family)
MLKHSKHADAKVTFFVTGRWAEKNPVLLKQLAQAVTAFRTMVTAICILIVVPGSGQRRDQKSRRSHRGITGTKTRYFASPYGEFNANVVAAAHNIDYKSSCGAFDTVDWKRPLPETIVSRVMKKAHNDAIILMHPTEPTLKALPEMLRQLQAEKYQLLPIDQVVLDAPSKSDQGGKADEKK